jgi:RNA polymerase-binding transcription factor DksA
MERDVLDSLAQLLHQQRDHFLKEYRRAEENLEAIAEERESELEEHAQEEQSALYLTSHDDQTLQTVKEIDAALQRILDGAYGVCERCHKAIPFARLKALPATRFCKACARKNETSLGVAAVATEVPPAAPIPADLLLLDDHELTETIREHVKEDGRVDMQELHIVCRKGVVYLSGKVPSEGEHQILLHTLTDVLGLQEIVDHIDVEELVWETERRTRESAPEVTQRWEELPGTEDIVESHEEGKEFIAPAKPTPDE